VIRPISQKEIQSSLFKASTFVVFDSDYSKWPLIAPNMDAVIKTLKKQEGNVIATVNPKKLNEDTICIVGDRPKQGYSMKVQHEMRESRFDFVHCDYITQCLAANELLPLPQYPHLYVKPSDATKKRLRIDEFGYNMADAPMTIESLLGIYDRLDPMFEDVRRAKKSKTKMSDYLYDRQVLDDIVHALSKGCFSDLCHELDEEDRTVFGEFIEVKMDVEG
jgi:hypothetical protein